jgi:SAM-dependent methyltransferase
MTPLQKALAATVGESMDRGDLAMEGTHCICGLPGDDKVIAQVDRYGLPMQTVVCLDCGTLRANPYLDESSLRRFYGDYYQDLYARVPEPHAYFETQKKYGARVLAAIRAIASWSQTVVEVGCGAGGALAAIEEAGLKVAGCDHSERLVRFGHSKGLARLVVGDLGNLVDAVPDLGVIDIIYLHHVFEHISDPLGFLRTCKAQLSPSGALIVMVPDVSRIDKFAFPGGDIRLFLHIAHKFNYSRRGLALLGAASGYSVEFIDRYESQAAPELWAVFRPQNSTPAGAAHDADGRAMLQYLRRTELRYRLGLLPGYQPGTYPRIRRLAKALLRTRLAGWLIAMRNKARRAGARP